MATVVSLIDRGRGPQLPHNRITVHDLVPYFQDGCSHEEIVRWLPSLTCDEVAIFEQYYREHRDELDDHERHVRERRAEQIRLQRLRFPEPEGPPAERLERLRELLKRHRQEGAGEGAHR